MDYLNLNGKTALVLGIANRWSIAYAIAELLQEHGVRLAVTYQNERIGAEVGKLTSDWSNVLYLPCELTEDPQIETVFAKIKTEFGQLNHLIHCIAYADRAAFLGDPASVALPLTRLLSKSYAGELRARIDPDHARPAAEIRANGVPVREGSNTTHFSVIDRFGNAVANTTTLNFSYGVGLIAEGTGVLLNNELDDFAAKPGAPNAYGLVGGEAKRSETLTTSVASPRLITALAMSSDSICKVSADTMPVSRASIAQTSASRRSDLNLNRTPDTSHRHQAGCFDMTFSYAACAPRKSCTSSSRLASI